MIACFERRLKQNLSRWQCLESVPFTKPIRTPGGSRYKLSKRPEQNLDRNCASESTRYPPQYPLFFFFPPQAHILLPLDEPKEECSLGLVIVNVLIAFYSARFYGCVGIGWMLVRIPSAKKWVSLRFWEEEEAKPHQCINHHLHP